MDPGVTIPIQKNDLRRTACQLTRGAAHDDMIKRLRRDAVELKLNATMNERAAFVENEAARSTPNER